ncbi:general secretion pathway protein K [Fontimonas thermophila]|uniref:Type II secretion system protein K n=1 Tax=Fontimonas thermophila TaxID=1076937 RepID=A0A1I2HQ11_9GAMM|nr:type II secretion system minor pseudopilin GspK [Fontimonas thermophila]SFF32425.1 general secretion pathway protein K [Fontimonas thermophila]
MMRRPQSGIALITAVLVVALAAIASAAILSSTQIAIRRTANLQDSERAWWYADGVESWVKSILERDLEDNQTDSYADAWAHPVDYLPIDEGFIRGQVIDLQGLYNLNNLAAATPAEFKKQQEIFVRLLSRAEIADEFQAHALAAAIRDWADADSEPTGFDGAEDTEYLGIDPPYRVANRLFTSVSELLAVKGVTPEIYARLANLVTALPETGVPINVNTAPPVLLQALAAQPRPEIEQFVRERAEKPAASVSELFNERALYTAQDADQSLMSVTSRYFMLRAEVFVGSSRVALYSWYFRPRSGIPVVLGRSIDTQ